MPVERTRQEVEVGYPKQHEPMLYALSTTKPTFVSNHAIPRAHVDLMRRPECRMTCLGAWGQSFADRLGRPGESTIPNDRREVQRPTLCKTDS
jgi:hypothetical protein